VINKDGTRVYSCSDDKSIKIWNLTTRSHVKTIQNAHDNRIYALCITNDQEHVISGDEKGCIKIWIIKEDGLNLKSTIKDPDQSICFNNMI